MGWRRALDDLIVALDSIAAVGSELWLFCDAPIEQRVKALALGGLDVATGLKRITLHHAVGDPVSRRDLEKLPLETFDAVLILAELGSSAGVGADTAASSSASAADSKTLATLLLIRDIQTQRLQARRSTHPDEPLVRTASRRLSTVSNLHSAAVHRCAVISEILDTRTRHLVSETGLCDFVLSNELISNALAMVAEDLSVNAVLHQLFTASGDELRVSPVSLYAAPGERLSFWDMAARARSRRQVLIGAYCAEADAETAKAVDDSASRHGQVFGGRSARRATLNPPDKAVVRSWGPADFVVVIGAPVTSAAAQ